MSDVTVGRLQRADVRELAHLHREAFPGCFLSRLGEPFLTQFYSGFISDESAVARDSSGRPLGAVVGTTEPAGFFGRLVRRKLVGLAFTSLRAVVAHPSAAPRLLRALAYRGDTMEQPGGALLSSICVDPRRQAGGVGSLLVAAWEATAPERGARSAYLTTDAADNDSVNAFYLARGWLLSSTSNTREGRSMNCYTKNLDGR